MDDQVIAVADELRAAPLLRALEAGWTTPQDRAFAIPILAWAHAVLVAEPADKALRSEGEMSDKVDWRFWEIHIGEIDISHRLRLRAAIDEEVRRSPECEREIRIGYEKSKGAWDPFWSNIFEAESQLSVAVGT